MELESIDIKRINLKPGTIVRVFSDEWFYNGKVGIMLDPNPVEESSHCLLEIDGETVTISINDVFKYEGK